MKNNVIHIITTTLTVGVLVGFGSTKITGDFVAGFAAGLGYLTVAALVAVAARDYGRSPRNYTA